VIEVPEFCFNSNFYYIYTYSIWDIQMYATIQIHKLTSLNQESNKLSNEKEHNIVNILN